MLWIRDRLSEIEAKLDKKDHGWVKWHVGEPIPTVSKSHVVHFQADGEELNLILQAMKREPKIILYGFEGKI